MKCLKCGQEISDTNQSPYDDLCKSCYETRCEGCAYNIGGCLCQDFMAATCIPTYDKVPFLEKLRLMAKEGVKQK